MSNKLFRGAAIGLAAALTMTGCGPGDANGSGDGKVTLNMVESLTSPARTTLIKSQLADFQKANPNITVNLISPPTDSADQKIQQMLQSGKGIDVLEARDITVGPFSSNGWLYDMKSDLQGWDGWNDLTDNAKSYATQNGKAYYVPYGFYGLSTYYRTDLIKQSGFDSPPHSWDDLIKQAEKINDPSKNQYGYAFRGGKNGNTNAVAIIEAYVADKLDTKNAFKLKDGSTIFSAPEAKTAMQSYIELFKNGSPPSSIAWGYPEMVQGFSSGSTAFLLQDPEVIETLGQSQSITKDQWSTTPLLVGPSGKAAQPVATAGWGIAQSSQHKAEALKLTEFLTSGPRTVEFAKKNSLVPIVKSATDDPFFKTGPWAAYVTMNQHPDTYLNVIQPRTVSWWSEWVTKSDSELQQALTGKMTTDQLLASWDQYWTAKWKTAGQS
ncbi:ABC transporter substrate-binding protein [Arthrobacter oryzae]|uniref:Multiple sugar transport system substrate-binding protein n=1 Tax=Arthrobacter oryzae TaxID=409290 RepID=A0A495ES51_9MICC|nr:sugar ABC transporter substrate-binding protein [Arthrobacter oryzae]RKR19808.1 multiple sugar transport system substrate-binding protein [Arthrobacter oryzae]